MQGMVYVLPVPDLKKLGKKGCRNIRGRLAFMPRGFRVPALQNSTSTEPTDAIPVLRLLDSCLLA
jgi:hypothetical protein